MIGNRPEQADKDHQVLPFRPRKSLQPKPEQPKPEQRSPEPRAWRTRASGQPASPVEDLGKYEVEEPEDNYRHRMLVNLAALLATVALALAGAWLAFELADLRKKQDCVLSGRQNCMPIDHKSLAH